MRWADGFIAVDWGTTNRRAYRIDGEGTCVSSFEDDKGVLSVATGGFPAAVGDIRAQLGDLPGIAEGTADQRHLALRLFECRVDPVSD